MTKGGIIAVEGVFLVLWSSGFIGAKYGLPYAGTFTLLFFRYLILTVVLFGWLAMSGKLRRIGSSKQIRHAVFIGLLAHFAWLVAVLEATDLGVPPGTVALIAALQPMVTGILAGPVLGERVNVWQWGGLFAGFLGVLLVVGDRVEIDETVPWWAYAVPLISTISLTLATLYQRSLETRTSEGFLPVINNLAVQCAATTVVLLPLAAGIEGMEAEWNGEFVFALGWLTFVVSLGAYGMLIFLVKKCPATRVASLLYLTPPVTMIMDYLVFGSLVTINGLVGLVIASAGVFLVRLGGFPTKKAAVGKK
ncbi:MAG: DMT family transporter [Gammaproteobacteria bacterium]